MGFIYCAVCDPAFSFSLLWQHAAQYVSQLRPPSLIIYLASLDALDGVIAKLKG
jgi:hypothetical protein